ncbi:MAG: 2-oxo acid dehydrogenase subunit E2 [Candidatus Neomarinimicrobiota bacterium]|nr:2-oxo acid dehydrogenase subunit E2 [Candidatus Neomarinimicrobiota bacterium]
MIKEIILPDLGEGIDAAEVSEVTVSVGDFINPDDTILVLESEKASMEIPADVTGTVREVAVQPGDEITTGQLLFKIELSLATAEIEKTAPVGDKPDLEPEKTPSRKTINELSPPLPMGETTSTGDVFASPGVRRLSRELGISLHAIKGTGPKSRITKNDLHDYIKIRLAIAAGGTVNHRQLDVDYSQWGAVEVQKLTKVKRITGQRLQQAWQAIPHVTQFDTADITDLDAYRKAMKKNAMENNIKVTFLPFLMKAVVKVLEEMPQFNSSLDHSGENLVLKHYYHLGVAVDTPQGLTVPVVQDVDQKSVLELSEALMDVSTRARNKKLKPDELKGGTFTISSLGGVGGTHFTPIVNPPEVAILGVSRSHWQAVYDSVADQITPRYILPFSLSYDHQVIDGAAGAAFTSRFAAILEDIEQFK